MRKGQIKIIGEGEPSDDVTLYCHESDPMYVLPAILMASITYKNRHRSGNRPGKVAAFICAGSPQEFEPRAGHDLRSDVEYFYKLYTKDEDAWELEILKRSKAPESKLETVVERTLFSKIVSPTIEVKEE